jgi:hypothetical protein
MMSGASLLWPAGKSPAAMNPAVIRQSLFLDGFDPEQLAEIVRGGRFDHYILND